MRDVATHEPRWIVVGVACALGWTLAKVAIPLFALHAIDEGIDPYDRGALVTWCSAILGATLITGVFTFYRRRSAFAISLRAEAELRRRLFDHLQRLHFGYHDSAQIGELMARVSIDAKQVQMLLVFIPIAGANFVMVTGVAVVLFVVNAKLAVVALATLPVLLVLANLSAGERQLVSITRAALADPAVVVLDEATSSLDPGTELIVEDALERLMRGRTVIVIAHRLSTAARADLVVVVNHGRLVEVGSHAELVAKGGEYTALYASWTGGARL